MIMKWGLKLFYISIMSDGIALLVPNVQIASNREAQRRCHKSKHRKNHTNELVLLSEDFFC